MTDSDTSPDDSELMARLQGGDDRALTTLMDRWQIPLRRFIYRSLNNEADALDLAQETFVRVYTHRAKFRPGAKFSTWLFSIALNLCRDGIRRRKVRPSVPLDEAGLAAASDRSVDTSGAAPDSDLLRAETAQTVRSAVEALPEPLKTAVLLCEYEDLSLAEAAEVVGCSAKAVETRLYRARTLLRESLAAFF
ncbi:MAG TPA: sigma-70 family RNA polymerase sigma factor [Opitutaceae bacterium]|nr:sigma-70 family RNA polymerase sigma factor [Lacunisphaera sp.]HWA09144.1 sigma-70 family RNA polymerase sigma factor [Opitutaceae bacterium]